MLGPALPLSAQYYGGAEVIPECASSADPWLGAPMGMIVKNGGIRIWTVCLCLFNHLQTGSSKRYLSTAVHSGAIHSSQKVNTTHMSISRPLERHSGTSCSEILPSCRKEGDSDMCFSCIKPYRHYAKLNKPSTKGHTLCDSTYVRYLESSGSSRQIAEWWLQGLEGGGDGELWFTGTGLQLGAKGFWRWTVVIVAQPCECPSCP